LKIIWGVFTKESDAGEAIRAIDEIFLQSFVGPNINYDV
jgi:hypothetical protein